MSEATTEDRVRRIIVTHLGVSPDDVTANRLLVPEASPSGGVSETTRPHLNADSLDVVELVMAFEDEFGIQIEDEEAEKLQTGNVGDAVALIDRLVQSEAQAA